MEVVEIFLKYFKSKILTLKVCIKNFRWEDTVTECWVEIDVVHLDFQKALAKSK